MLLLPSTTSKFLAKWQGPYPILERLSDVTYAMVMVGDQKRRRVFHVNMLKQWREECAMWCEETIETFALEDGPIICTELADEQ